MKYKLQMNSFEMQRIGRYLCYCSLCYCSNYMLKLILTFCDAV